MTRWLYKSARIHTFRWGVLAIVSAAVGCSGSSSGPVTHPVSGVVTLAGQPIADALVHFIPANGDATLAGAQARTDSDGRFEMYLPLEMGRSSQRGLPAGDYLVTVTKMELGAGVASLDRPPKNALPAEYSSPQTTKLSAKVNPDGDNHFEFKL